MIAEFTFDGCLSPQRFMLCAAATSMFTPFSSERGKHMNEIITDAIGKALFSTGYVLLEAVLQPAMIPVLIAPCGLIFLKRTIPR